MIDPKKCFCDEVPKGELCDHCEREQYLQRQEEAIERVLDGDF
jgi:hypothetical protein